MAINTSVPIINPDDQIDEKVRQYFTEYYSETITVNPSEYDAVKGFFKEKDISGNNDDAVAANTVALLISAKKMGVYPQEIIEKMHNSDYQKTLGLIFNLSRSGTSLIGYKTTVEPSAENKRQVTP
tara:strand:+ start:210 stop:587 length:378 start_codon:yes stop_codon:yes gene_type:complete